MAGQAHYTSAPPGTGGRYGGFRFTAVSPAARPALEALRPLTAYTPPPGAARPGDFPVAFAYDRPAENTAVLTLTRFTGRDYSGRLGNHFCHALVAEPAELTGLRPVDLWDSPLWAAAPAPDDGHDLPDLAHLAPGRAVGPQRVSHLLRETGEPGARLLERLLTAALRALSGEGPGVTLVAAGPERVLDWITAVCYALPAALAARLTFTTYTARPQDDHRHLTGTLPRTADRARGPVLHLDLPSATVGADGLPPGPPAGDPGPPPCPAARFLARAWTDGDLDALDTAAELWEADPAARPGTAPSTAAADGVRGLRAACALLDADRARLPGDGVAHLDVALGSRTGVSSEVTALLDRFAAAGRTLPDAVQRRLAASAAPPGLSVAVRLAPVAPALRDLARQVVEAALADGRVAHPAGGRTDDAEDAGRLTGFTRALAELRLPDLDVTPEHVRDAVARHLADPAVPPAPARIGDVPAALAPLPEPYRGAVLAGLLAALEGSEDLRAAVLDARLCAYLADEALDPLREPPDEGRAADPLAAAPRTALHVLRRAAAPDPAHAARRVLRLYRAGLLTETETYDAVRDLACADVPQRSSRLPWRRGGAARERE
jgi:hypothetical protein